MSRIYRPEHNFARECVPKNPVKILDKLTRAGFGAYLVGGSVRDILLSLRPKDFDIATSARPEEVKKIFKNCRLIGRRFRLAHIYFGREIIEVATFRAPAYGDIHNDNEHALSSAGQIMRDNVYGNLEQDAARRDFTINSLYYSWQDDCVIDFHNGVRDINNKLLELIGDPGQRFLEDPVRMLRAVRFAVKLGFDVEAKAKDGIYQYANLLANIPPARLFEEFLKLFQYGFAQEVFWQLEQYGLLQYLFPSAARAIKSDEVHRHFILQALADTDKRIKSGARTTPAYLLAVFLYSVVTDFVQNCQEPINVCTHKAAKNALRQQRKHTSMPKRFAEMAKSIWELQPRLARTKGKRPFKTLEHPKFRAAYDFMLLRHKAGESELEILCDWWTRFQNARPPERRKMAGFKNKPR